MSVPEKDLTGMWTDQAGESRQVIGREPKRGDDVWRTRRPTGWTSFTSDSYIRLNWTRVTDRKRQSA